MKVKSWIRVTSVEDSTNIRCDDDFYKSSRDDEKTIASVYVQDNGVVVIRTKEDKRHERL